MLHHFLQRNSICNGRGCSESHLICGLRHGASGHLHFSDCSMLIQIHPMHLSYFSSFWHPAIYNLAFICMHDFPPTGHVPMHEMQIPFHHFPVHVFNWVQSDLENLWCETRTSLQTSLKLQTRNSTDTMERYELHAKDPGNKQYPFYWQGLPAHQTKTKSVSGSFLGNETGILEMNGRPDALPWWQASADAFVIHSPAFNWSVFSVGNSTKLQTVRTVGKR